MDPYLRNRWLLSTAFSVIIIAVAVMFEGGLLVFAVTAVAIVYFLVVRNYRPR